MKFLVYSVLLIFSINTNAQTKAYKDCLDWFKLFDQKKYELSWIEADSIFQNSMKKKSWVSLAEKTMKPYGKVLSRKMIKFSEHTSLPGVKDGKYIIYQFKSRYKLNRKVTETITFKKGKHNIWRLAGYYIK
jgi:hypothetical protein